MTSPIVTTAAGSSTEPITRTPEDLELARRLATVYRILIQAAKQARGTTPQHLDAPEAGDSQNRSESTSGPVKAQADEIDRSVDQGDQPPSTAPIGDESGRMPR